MIGMYAAQLKVEIQLIEVRAALHSKAEEEQIFQVSRASAFGKAPSFTCPTG